jgi:hypothetical protein
MKNFFSRKILGGALLIGFLFLLVSPVLAQGIVPCGIDKDGSWKLDWAERCTLCDLIVGIKKIFDYGIKTIAIITLACATFAGVMYVVSSGNESAMESAKNFLKASLIGLAVVICAWLMVNTIITVLMPTKTTTDTGGSLGIGKKWAEFGRLDCSDTAPRSTPSTVQPND